MRQKRVCHGRMLHTRVPVRRRATCPSPASPSRRTPVATKVSLLKSLLLKPLLPQSSTRHPNHARTRVRHSLLGDHPCRARRHHHRS